MLVCYPIDLTPVSSLKNITIFCLLENKSSSHIIQYFYMYERGLDPYNTYFNLILCCPSGLLLILFVVSVFKYIDKLFLKFFKLLRILWKHFFSSFSVFCTVYLSESENELCMCLIFLISRQISYIILLLLFIKLNFSLY